MSKRLVYVCEGGDCSEKGSVELHNDLKERLLAADPEMQNKVRKYPCFGGCEHGINMTLYPDKVFLSMLSKADLPALCDYLTGQAPCPAGKTGVVPKDVEEIVWDLLDTGF
jgi:NADH:ubiquinone oxidoreductase subunit E